MTNPRLAIVFAENVPREPIDDDVEPITPTEEDEMPAVAFASDAPQIPAPDVDAPAVPRKGRRSTTTPAQREKE